MSDFGDELVEFGDWSSSTMVWADQLVVTSHWKSLVVCPDPRPDPGRPDPRPDPDPRPGPDPRPDPTLKPGGGGPPVLAVSTASSSWYSSSTPAAMMGAVRPPLVEAPLEKAACT